MSIQSVEKGDSLSWALCESSSLKGGMSYVWRNILDYYRRRTSEKPGNITQTLLKAQHRVFGIQRLSELSRLHVGDVEISGPKVRLWCQRAFRHSLKKLRQLYDTFKVDRVLVHGQSPASSAWLQALIRERMGTSVDLVFVFPQDAE